MTNFTFLTGASHPEEMMLRAAELGLRAIAITDRNSLAGVVRAWTALRNLQEEAEEALAVRSDRLVDTCSRQDVGHKPPLRHRVLAALPKLIVGARLVLSDCPVEWVALPVDRAAYGRLTRLLTLGKGRTVKGKCDLRLADLRGANLAGADFQGVILFSPQPPASGDRFIAAPPEYTQAALVQRVNFSQVKNLNAQQIAYICVYGGYHPRCP